MRRLLPRQRAAVAIAIAFTVCTMGAALAGPEFPPFGNPNVTLDVSPNDGDNLPSPATITVTGQGFGNNAGNILQCSFSEERQFDICSDSLARFTANNGTFTTSATVTNPFTGVNENNEQETVDCNVTPCTVQAITDSGQFFSQHHISFGTAPTSSTTTSTTAAPTTSSSTTTSTTAAPTTTSSTTTSTTAAPTTTSSTTTSTTAAPTTSSSTTTSTTAAPTTSSSTTTSTTAAPTTSSSTTTSTTAAPTTSSSTTLLPATSTTLSTSQCGLLQQARTRFNAQIDATILAINASTLSASQKSALLTQLQAIRAQGNAQISQALASLNCPT